MAAEEPLRRFFDWLDFWPKGDPADPRWRPWYARPGDVIEVVSLQGWGVAPEVLGQFSVAAANPRFLKLADQRVFEQDGWPVFSGKGSCLRWRKVK
jgi:hypothetical protein